MDEFLKFISDEIKNGKFDKLLTLIMVVYNCFTPGYIWIFFFKRNLYTTIGNINVVILSVVLSTLLFTILLCIAWCLESYYHVQKKKILTSRDKNYKNDLKNENIMIQAMIMASINSIPVSLFPLLDYFFTIIQHNKLNFQIEFITVIIYLIALNILYIVWTFKRVRKI